MVKSAVVMALAFVGNVNVNPNFCHHFANANEVSVQEESLALEPTSKIRTSKMNVQESIRELADAKRKKEAEDGKPNVNVQMDGLETIAVVRSEMPVVLMIILDWSVLDEESVNVENVNAMGILKADFVRGKRILTFAKS